MPDLPAGVASSWLWEPVQRFRIDLQIGDAQLVTEIDAPQRQDVATSLARLAQSIFPVSDVRLIWVWPDGAEWDLDGKTLKEAADA